MVMCRVFFFSFASLFQNCRLSGFSMLSIWLEWGKEVGAEATNGIEGGKTKDENKRKRRQWAKKNTPKSIGCFFFWLFLSLAVYVQDCNSFNVHICVRKFSFLTFLSSFVQRSAYSGRNQSKTHAIKISIVRFRRFPPIEEKSRQSA